MSRYVCESCGAPINPLSGVCEYCGSRYRIEHGSVLMVENCKAVKLCAECAIPNEIVFHNADSASEIALSEMSRKIADTLKDYLKIVTRKDEFLNATIIRGEIRVLPPSFRF